MADRIKGITIEIGGDTTKLSDSLKDVNKSIKDTQAELKDVDKLLKLDPSNLELLAQKQELLGKATQDTKEKLEKLKQAQEQLKANGVDETSAEYRALSREIADTEQQMKKLGDEALETDKKILSVASGAEKVADSTKKMANATKGLSTAAAGAVTGLVALGVKAGQDADDLNTLAKQTGLSTEALQKMQYASDLIDVNVDDITGAVKKMKKQLDSGADKFDAIGVSVKDINGEYRDTETIFYETIRALGRIENETERDVVAMDLFGKSADDLAGLIDDGGKAFRRLGDEAKANGSIISQEDLDKANELNDTIDKMKQEFSVAFAEMGVSIAQAIKPLAESLLPVIQKVAEFIGNLSPQMITVIGIILSLVAVLSPLLSLISAIATAMPIILAVVGGITAPVLGIIAVIGLVITAIVVLIKHWDDIKTAAKLMGEIIVETWNKIKDKTVEIWSNITNAIREKIDNIKNTVKNGIESIKNWWSNMKLNFPHIKLPHFKLNGTFSLNPPRVPKIGVDWYKKAYDDAYLLNSPTIFGQSSNGQLLGGGEGNGSEAVVGTDKLMSMMSDVVGNQNITVVLEGDAQGVFNLVRTENSRFMKSNGGYSPLMS